MPGGGGGGDSSERQNARLNFSFRRSGNRFYNGNLSAERLLNTPDGYRDDGGGRGVKITRTAQKPLSEKQANVALAAPQQRAKKEKVAARNQNLAQTKQRKLTAIREQEARQAQESNNTNEATAPTSRTTERTAQGESTGATGSKSPTLGRRRGAFGGQGALSRRTLLSSRG